MILTSALLDLFLETRQNTEDICRPLEIEDYVVQPVVDVSPPKWHLGHTTWFFEEFILKPYSKDYQIFDEDFAFVFNSYYETVGKRVVRADRGNLSRPSVQSIYDYRHAITEAIRSLYEKESSEELLYLLEIGIHHEKQHQELLLTDIKYILAIIHYYRYIQAVLRKMRPRPISLSGSPWRKEFTKLAMLQRISAMTMN